MFAIRIFVFAMLLAAAGYVGWKSMAPSASERLNIERDSANTPVELRIGAVALRVPPSFLRRPEDMAGGPTRELQLAMDARAFGPAPQVAPLAPGETEAMADIVYLMLTAPDPAVDPADRMARLYGRFLESEVGASIAGLESRRFEPGSPYEGEDLFFNPPEGRLFAARCLRATDPQPPGQCMADLRVAGLDVRLRFSRRHLENWDHLATGVIERISGMVR